VKRPLSLHTYLTFSHIIIVSVSLAVIGFVTSARQQSELTDELELQMLLRLQSLASSFEPGPGAHLSEQLALLEVPGPDIQTPLTAIFIDDRRQLHNLTDFDISAPVQASLLELSRTPYTDETSISAVLRQPGLPQQLYVMTPIQVQGQAREGTLCLLAPLAPLQGYITRQNLIFGGLILGLSLLGMLSSILLTRPMIRRAVEVEQLATGVIQSDYHIHAPETGPREARQISSALNVMVDRLQEQEQERRTILANVTHELGRPLAGLRLGVESLQKGALQSPALAEDLLAEMNQTVQHMGMILEDISLAISPLSHPLTLHRTYIAVEPFLQGLASRFWNMAEVRGVKVNVQVPRDLPQLYADEQRLRQIMGNLIHNAIKFTPRGQVIDLSAEAAEDSMLRLYVRDRGPGLDQDAKERLFEPFFQGTHGRIIQQGMGLGLSIALYLVRLHAGRLELKHHPEGGVLASVTLPAEPA